MSSLFANSTGSSQPLHGSTESREPMWLQSNTKRVIPNHLVPKKKIGFQLSNVTKNDKQTETKDDRKSTSDNFNNSDFNLITFGNKVHRNSTASFADSLALLDLTPETKLTTAENSDDLPLYNFNEDLPPPKSLYDLNDEAFLSSSRPAQQTESFMNKDPKTFHNAFDKSATQGPQASKNDKLNENPLSHLELAIVVFGYPESLANQVIAHFLEFGTILEHLEAAKSSAKVSAQAVFEGQTTGSFKNATPAHESGPAPPIFSGKSWIKLTYDNPSSAMDALQENGAVFNGAMIGVVPYTKDTVEKLQKRKISDKEDIGAGLPVHNSAHPSADKGVMGDSKDIQASYIQRLDIRDGSELFLKATNHGNLANGELKKPDQKLGFWGTVSNYLFGFHDL